MNGDRRHTIPDEEISHEIRMLLRDAECNRAQSCVLAKLIQRVPGALLRRRSLCQRSFIKAAATPWNIRIVDCVRHPEIPERTQLSARNAIGNITSVNEVVATQGKQVSTVASLRRRRQSKHELGTEVIDQLPVCTRIGVMKLVHNDVVESVGQELIKVSLPALKKRNTYVINWEPSELPSFPILVNNKAIKKHNKLGVRLPKQTKGRYNA